MADGSEYRYASDLAYHPPQKWEYKTDIVAYGELDSYSLNKFGGDGWQLVSRYERDGFTNYIFMRPKS